MKPPTYYSNRLSELEFEYDQYNDDGDHSGVSATVSSVNKLKREVRNTLNKGADPNDEATSTRRFRDAEKRHNEYYTANWVLFFAMLGVGGTYFRRNSI